MTLATWIIAIASAITAAVDTVFTLRLSHTGRVLFLHHDRRISKLENGAPK